MKLKKLLLLMGVLILCLYGRIFTVSAAESNHLSSFELGGNAPYYRVELSNLKLNGSYRDIRFAVWSEDKGQDDLVWYSARSGKGVYYVEIPLNNHDSNGKFQVHAYALMTDGRMQILNITTFTYQSSAAISVRDTSGTEKEFQVSVNTPKAVGGIQQIQAAVWSKTGGQDDIIWYNVSANGGSYTAKIPVSNHRTAGEYYVHVYARNQRGSMILLGTSSFSVNGAAKADVQVSMADRRHGRFQIKVSNISALSGVAKVQVPVWCSNDQSDIVWYDAVRQSDGSYTVNADIGKHKNHTGEYKIHAYVQMGNGVLSFAGNTVYEYLPQSDDRYYTAVHACEQIICTPLTQKNGYYQIENSAPVLEHPVKRLEYAVWSDRGGKDDELWFTAESKSDGMYGAEIPMDGFYDLGLFHADVYALLNDGRRALIQSGTFTLGDPSVSGLQISNVNLAAGTFRVSLSGISNPESIRNIKVDLHTTAAGAKHYTYDVMSWSGGYYLDVNIANMDYTFGTYVAELKVTDITGNTKTAASASVDMKPKYTRINQTDYYNNETVRGVFLENLVVPGGTTQVQFAVWSAAGGQDDLIWYPAEKDGTYYYYYINISEHRTLGDYNVHIYATKKNGKQELIAAEKFSINAKPSGKIRISNVNGTTGRMRVTVYDLDALPGVSHVEVPVWCSSDQSDIKWYTAERQSDGTYVADVYVGNHKYHFGNYIAHAYVTMRNGIRCFVNSTSANITANNFIRYEKLSEGTARVTLMNAGGGRAQGVTFPTWSVANGQDDIQWYQGANDGWNNWSVIVNTDNHRDYGDFVTHAYVTYDGWQTMANQIGYTLKGNDFTQKLGSFSTVSVNNANGTFNMSKALLSFNGLVVQPGETVSFFAVAGPCGFADGYKVAGTVQGTGYGGGICQASTTLYGGALRAGMTIVERRSHSQHSVYVPIGQDAMVSYGSSDFKFRNDLSRPVKIVTYVTGKQLNVEFWGVQPDWYDSIQINSWSTGRNSAAAERVYYKNGVAVKVERLTNSYYPKG